jgi:hypothetical protein
MEWVVKLEAKSGWGEMETIEHGVQRPKPEFGFCNDNVMVLDLVVKQIIELTHIEQADREREFAVDRDMDAVGRGAAPAAIPALRGAADGLHLLEEAFERSESPSDNCRARPSSPEPA